jgi:hypothetical protein
VLTHSLPYHRFHAGAKAGGNSSGSDGSDEASGLLDSVYPVLVSAVDIDLMPGLGTLSSPKPHLGYLLAPATPTVMSKCHHDAKRVKPVRKKSPSRFAIASSRLEIVRRRNGTKLLKGLHMIMQLLRRIVLQAHNWSPYDQNAHLRDVAVRRMPLSRRHRLQNVAAALKTSSLCNLRFSFTKHSERSENLGTQSTKGTCLRESLSRRSVSPY